jgi:hypothetical protein
MVHLFLVCDCRDDEQPKADRGRGFSQPDPELWFVVLIRTLFLSSQLTQHGAQPRKGVCTLQRNNHSVFKESTTD